MAAYPVRHPLANELRAFALGKTNESTSAALMVHLDSCPDCCKVVAALSGDDFLNRLRQARGQSSTPAPAKALPQSAATPKPPPSQHAIPNLPLELANNPQYEILRELGRGGMGVVYLAKNKLMDRLEVLKVVNKTLLDHPAAVERFLREIRSAAKLSHANVVTAYSALQLGELLAFAMEYIAGQDLASLVKAQGPPPIPHACFYVQQAAHGLQHAFEKQMVHRDIKPQNLILAREGKKHIVKVLDFGLAKVMREKTDDSSLTGEGKMLGTPDYIAPEQTMDAAHADIRADIYSLGCTLYYLLSGHPPFSGTSLGAILVAHQMHEAKPLNLVRPEVPEELAALVRKMMAKTPAKRYQTPLEVVQALSPFVKQGAAPKPSPELSRGMPEAKPVVKMPARGDPPPAPVAQLHKPQPVPANVWESLMEESSVSVGAGKSEAVRKQRAASARQRKPQKNWLHGRGIAIGMLLALLGLGLWLGAGGIFKTKVKTADGEAYIVLEIDQPDAEVTVDGQNVRIQAPGDNKPIEIQVAPGQHKLRIRKDGFAVVSKDVELKSGKSAPIRVRLEPVKAVAKGGKAPPRNEAQGSDVEPLRLELNGLNGLKYLTPISFGPDWLGNNPRNDPSVWAEKDLFARLRSTAALSYASVPISTYVFETELECLTPDCGVRICLGDPWTALHLNLFWNSDRQKVECTLMEWRYGWWGWNSSRDFNLRERLRFKLVVVDGQAALFQNDRLILTGENSWPADLALRIWSATDDSAAIHRCSFRALTDADLKPLPGWVLPVKDLVLKPAETEARLKRQQAGLQSQPKPGSRFLAAAANTAMAWVAPGEFLMGPSKADADDRHRVKISRGFWMGQYEVTQKEWTTLMKDNPSRKRGSPYLPVDWVSWDAARDFCALLNKRETAAGRMPAGYEYRLPTEAEWEFACRAGSSAEFSIPEQQVYSRDHSQRRPHEVGEGVANAWGFYDMHGNAMEWCLDCWYDYPKKNAELLVDPVHVGNAEKDLFVVRGGAWWKAHEHCSSSWRDKNHSRPAGGYRGFRIVLGPIVPRG